MASWPSDCPQYMQESGYQEKMADATVETNMDVGPVKVRSRGSRRSRMISGTVRMTQAQAATFETFWRSTCAGGALPFTWVHPRTRAAMDFRFRNPAPSYSVFGEIVDVSFTIEEV